jgi:hypothetical protein
LIYSDDAGLCIEMIVQPAPFIDPRFGPSAVRLADSSVLDFDKYYLTVVNTELNGDVVMRLNYYGNGLLIEARAYQYDPELGYAFIDMDQRVVGELIDILGIAANIEYYQGLLNP